MKSLRPRARSPLASLALLLITGTVAACAGAGAPASAPTATTGVAPSVAPTEAAAGTPVPTDLATVGIAVLPTANVDLAKVKVACDATTLGSGGAMTCNDIVKLSARIAATTSANPIKQVVVAKSTDNANGIDVTFWVKAEDTTDLTAFTSTIDPSAMTVTVPIENPDATFPA
jgi:hypothetical protein